MSMLESPQAQSCQFTLHLHLVTPATTSHLLEVGNYLDRRGITDLHRLMKRLHRLISRSNVLESP
jgi:hypothetical protein